MGTIQESEIKEFIIRTLDLDDVDPSEIVGDQPLFGDGLGLDSIDALELGVALTKEYGVSLEAEDEASRQHFASVKSLTAFVNRCQISEA